MNWTLTAALIRLGALRLGGNVLKNQIIGLVRFSYLSKNGFRSESKNREETRDALYAKERMDFRFRMVERLCIRSMQNQTDQDFKLIFLVGLDMPTVYLNRLKELIAPLPQADIVTQPRQWMVQATQAAFKKVIDPGADYVTTFRIDDDDAVAVDYIAQTRQQMAKLISAGMAEEPTVLAYTSGVHWEVEKKAKGLVLRSEATPLGLACAIITKPDLPVSVFRWDHRRFGSYFPTFLVPNEVMYIRTLHKYNDSRKQLDKKVERLSSDEMADVLRKRFQMNFEDFEHFDNA